MMEIEYGKEPKLHEVDQSKKEEIGKVPEGKRQQLLGQQLLEDKIKYLERKYREKNKPNSPDPEVLKELLYQLAKAIRNVEGKGPSSVGLEIGRLLCKLRCLDGERYDREVLLLVKAEVPSTIEGAVNAAKSLLNGMVKND